MTYDDGIVTFKSVQPFFDYEKDGLKPNTLRLVPSDELLALGKCTGIRVVLPSLFREGMLHEFCRDVSGMFDVTSVLSETPKNARLVMICWEHPGETP